MDARIFRGDETHQRDCSGQPADPCQWYWEPADYIGDVLWCAGLPTRDAAVWMSQLDTEEEG